jgi:SAM-dependent methyltransferase
MARPTRVQTLETIREDFDRLALLPDGWNHNRQYDRWLLRHVPDGCEDALDAGCGTGEFALQLALRCKRVLGIDLSPEMIEQARRRSAGRPALEFRVADLMDEAPAGRFDCIATIATLHHLPLEQALARLGDALRSGGVLLVLDVVANRNLGERLWAARAMPVATALRLWHRGRLRPTRAEREAWVAHCRTDRYFTLPEVRAACVRVLPGARVRRHLLWRYSIVWNKP